MMGLIRRLIRIIPPVAAFTIGYYIGTIDSGQYECVFENRYELNSPITHSEGLESQVISYERSSRTEE